ncbi:phosphatidylserine decarboxylase family protein [Nitrospirales bacterium NOB]|nr:MAG: phosphatidylserine decarboxylase [Nitrospira sp. OLB3]MBV6468835.1 Phosphatidylserine decarboxylase proenzyme [Nitrospirota bacterium]MCE7964166.1 phosphatidylserine decarboxylase family protein [Nitrospira sp. NTP2]MCK6498960.1 phosphatidylserine decarboxylase family protein [Nitrospira sp.]MDL1889106.1 phosphatidylserine decarboxylase family protein [Nitrospirales bacterium NOB]MEB2336983.1 phosphatidylserine decarboxylase family protein [Nitrospirales bacterium]
MADHAVGIPIVKEGWPFVGGLGGLALLFGGVGWPIPALVAGGFTLFTAWFFRNPSRTIPQQPNMVVSPGDGKVIAIEEEFEPRYLKEKSIRVTVFLNVFDVHVNRMPCAGIVEGVSYQPGQFLVASKPEATLHNEQNAVMLKAESGAKVLCVQVAGLIARRIVCWVGEGDRVERGERYGLIRFGSRMDTFLPLGSSIRVAVGDRVKGGESILGELR